MIEGVYLYFILAFVFILAIWLSSMTVKSIEGFFLWLMILVAILVYTSIFDLWILILVMIINIVIIGINIHKRGMI